MILESPNKLKGTGTWKETFTIFDTLARNFQISRAEIDTYEVRDTPRNQDNITRLFPVARSKVSRLLELVRNKKGKATLPNIREYIDELARKAAKDRRAEK